MLNAEFTQNQERGFRDTELREELEALESMGNLDVTINDMPGEYPFIPGNAALDERLNEREDRIQGAVYRANLDFVSREKLPEYIAMMTARLANATGRKKKVIAGKIERATAHYVRLRAENDDPKSLARLEAMASAEMDPHERYMAEGRIDAARIAREEWRSMREDIVSRPGMEVLHGYRVGKTEMSPHDVLYEGLSFVLSNFYGMDQSDIDQLVDNLGLDWVEDTLAKHPGVLQMITADPYEPTAVEVPYDFSDTGKVIVTARISPGIDEVSIVEPTDYRVTEDETFGAHASLRRANHDPALGGWNSSMFDLGHGADRADVERFARPEEDLYATLSFDLDEREAPQEVDLQVA